MEVIEESIWVLHLASSVVDRVKKVWTGKPGDQFEDPNGNKHEVRVIELESGNSFLDREGTEFQILTHGEVGFLVAAREGLDRLRGALEQTGAIAPRRMGIILASEFRRQARQVMAKFPLGSGG